MKMRQCTPHQISLKKVARHIHILSNSENCLA